MVQRVIEIIQDDERHEVLICFLKNQSTFYRTAHEIIWDKKSYQTIETDDLILAAYRQGLLDGRFI